jgi:hypothetical protein
MVIPFVLLLAAPTLVQSQKPNGPVSQTSAPQAPMSQPSAGPLAGGLFSAGQLRQRCLSNVPADASSCFAYITGVHDTVRAYEAWLNQREFCVPRHVPQGDLRQAFVDYLRDKPSDLSGEAASVVVVALKIRYACGRGARSGGTPPAPVRSGKP